MLNLPRADFISQAGAELRDEHGQAQLLSIFGPLSKAHLMPVEALGGMGRLWLARRLTLLHAELAAIGVHVEDVLVRATSSTWRRIKANWEDVASEEAKRVGEWTWLEPHLLLCIVRLVSLEEPCVHRAQVFLIHVARPEEHWIAGRVSREWLVEWVVTNDIGVLSKACRHMVPIRNELILQTVLVCE